MKAVVSDRIYMTKPEDSIYKSIVEKLTYKIEKRVGKHIEVEIIRNYKLMTGNILSLPRGRTDLIPKDYQIIDKTISVPVEFPETDIVLHEGQAEVYYEANSSCFLNALPGWGKTITALMIASKLGQKTLVITHTAILRDQWIKEANKIFGESAVSMIGPGKADLSGIIVIGNIQSVIKHLTSIIKTFGTVILDEAHHCPAATFTAIMDKTYAKYRIGLSGTMLRSDGKHILFQDIFGNIVFKPSQNNTINPFVTIIKSDFKLPASGVWGQKINTLLYNKEYQKFIAALALIKMSEGHKVLIIADRVEFLKAVKDIIGEKCILVTGDTDQEVREMLAHDLENNGYQAIAGSRQIFSEGISVNILSAVILAVPIANEGLLEQIIGRIMRKHPGKPAPEVLDINFSDRGSKRQNSVRRGLYIKKGWEMVSIQK